MKRYINFIIWGSIAVAIISLAVIYLFRRGSTDFIGEVVSVEPGQNEEIVGFYPLVKVQFKKGTNPAEFSVDTDPFINGSISVDESSNILLLRPAKRLSAGQTYTAIVKKKNKEMFRWEFVTATSSSDPDVLNELDDYHRQYYPLLEFLPRITNRYRIEYIDKNTLGIYTNLLSEELKKEIEDWIISVGVDPDTQVLEWRKD